MLRTEPGRKPASSQVLRQKKRWARMGRVVRLPGTAGYPHDGEVSLGRLLEGDHEIPAWNKGQVAQGWLALLTRSSPCLLPQIHPVISRWTDGGQPVRGSCSGEWGWIPACKNLLWGCQEIKQKLNRKTDIKTFLS